jgi:hypothetical protein
MSELLYITRSGLPLNIELQWPFHRSASGADFHVLHGTVTLADGSGLHALVAIQLTVTVGQMLPSLEPKHTAAPVINTIRKAVDRKELEFLKSPKCVPLPFSSRTYDFKRGCWVFGESTEAERTALLVRKLYWQVKFGAGRVWLADPVDAQYLDAAAASLLEIARALAAARLVELDGEYATITPQLMEKSGDIEAEMRQACEALERKHAFERG